MMATKKKGEKKREKSSWLAGVQFLLVMNLDHGTSLFCVALVSRVLLRWKSEYFHWSTQNVSGIGEKTMTTSTSSSHSVL